MSPMSYLDQAIQQVDNLIAQLAEIRPTPATAKTPSKAKKPAAPAPTAADKSPTTSKAKGSQATTQQQSNSNKQPGVTELFAKAQLQVALVKSVDDINSAKLYKCTVDVGNNVTKQVMAGLKQHISKAGLLHSLVVVISNLKPAKLAGELSEVMILAAQSIQQDSPQGELVQVLQPPEGSQAGDQVYLEDAGPSASYPKQLKSDNWKKIVAEFKAMQGVACCANQKLCCKHGAITVPHDIPDGAGIH